MPCRRRTRRACKVIDSECLELDSPIRVSLVDTRMSSSVH